jgi:hypothetical protein
MTDQNLSNKNELAEGASPESNVLSAPEVPRGEHAPDPAEHEARRQKQVMVLLWASVVILIVLGGILVYAKYHGLFESSDQNAPVPYVPAGS